MWTSARLTLASILTLSFVVLSLFGQAVTAQAQDSNADLWEVIQQEIDAAEIQNVTVMVGNADGTVFIYNKGNFTPDTAAELASSSKWLTAGTIMRLVEEGVFTLDDHPQDYIDWWTDDPQDPRSQITVADMLAFKSGMFGETATLDCVGDATITNDDCVRTIYEDWFQYEPGSTFYYGPTHMHILGLMAENATGMAYNDIFRQYLADPLGMSSVTGFFDPSASNPRPAGGAVSTAEDYMRYLHALFTGGILAESRDIMFTDHTASPVEIARSTVNLETNGLEWHYAFGAWRECDGAWSDACAERMLISSGGAYGWLPWIDLDNGYYALIAQRGRLPDRPSVQSIELANAIRPHIVTAISNHASASAQSNHTAEDTTASLYQPDAGAYEIRYSNITVEDSSRDRTIDLRVNYPAEPGQYPLILFSHSWRTSNEWYRPLVDFWVSHGYVVLQPNHLDSTGEEEILEASEAVRDWPERPADLSFLLDAIPEIEALVPELAGKINTNSVGVAGHSFGGNTAQLVGGAQPATPPSFVDERISAVVVISGWGTGFFDLDRQSWETFDNPMLLFTGTNDPSDRTGNTWEWRLEPFEYAQDGDKYAVIIDGAYHGYGGITREGDPGLDMGPANTDHVTYVRSTSLAFWDAYLKGSSDALTYLQSDSLNNATDGEAELRRR